MPVKGLLAFFAVCVVSLIGAASASAAIVINEIESSAPGDGFDYIELTNTGNTTVNIGGYYLKDDNINRTLQVATNTMLAPGGFYVNYVSDPAQAGNFGIGNNDQARVFLPDNATLLDTFNTPSVAAPVTIGRCPDGTGALAQGTYVGTPGAANDCSPLTTWPGSSAVTTVDSDLLATDVSGLAIKPSGTSAPGTLYASKNNDGSLFRLHWTGTAWAKDTTDGWTNGKSLKYPSGLGTPDAEGVTLNLDEPSAAYVSVERDGNGGTQPGILRYDVSGAATTLTATNFWDLTTKLPTFPANGSLEAITWIPDSVLVAMGFMDDNSASVYNPVVYSNHGSGLFFVGAELNGNIYAFALNQQTNVATKVATFSSGQPTLGDIEYEPETQSLYVECDNNCSGRVFKLQVAQSGADDGKFVPTDKYERPTGMPNVNNEGFAIAPQAECSNGFKPVIWSNDEADGGIVLRQGTIPCTAPVSPPPTDTDGDGVPDSTDQCPTVAGPASNNGCPVSQPNPPDDNAACDAAKKKLEKAKAKLKKLKKVDASNKKIKSAKDKVKKAKAAVKKAC